MNDQQAIPTFFELNQQRIAAKAELERLDRLVDEAKARERVKALADAQDLINSFGLTSAELKLAKATSASKSVKSEGRKRPVKFFNPSTGKTWSGIGNRPQCMRGMNMDDFVLSAMSPDTQSRFAPVVPMPAVEVANGQ